MSAAEPAAPSRLAPNLAVAVFLVVAATYVVNAMDRIVFPVLLPAVAGEPTPLHLVCPHRRQFSPAVKLLHALVEARCRPLLEALPGTV